MDCDEAPSLGDDFPRCDADVEKVGDSGTAWGTEGGTYIDWDDERRKKGIDDGVRRRDECPRRTELAGLRGWSDGPWGDGKSPIGDSTLMRPRSGVFV